MVAPILLLAAAGAGSQFTAAVPVIIATATASGVVVAEAFRRTFKRTSKNNDNGHNHASSQVKVDNRVESRAELENHYQDRVGSPDESSEAKMDQLRKRLRLRDCDFNVAVMGQDSKKSGKSSFINAICGLRDDAEDVANSEPTLEIKRYNDKRQERFVWYDIPDVNLWESNSSVLNYFRNEGLFLFDLVVVAIGNEPTTAEVDVPRICEELGLPLFIVRLESNEHVRNLMISMRYQITLKEARNRFVNQNRSFFKPEMKVYCVTADVLRGELPNDTIDEATLFTDLQAALREKFERLRDGSTARLKNRDSVVVGAANVA